MPGVRLEVAEFQSTRPPRNYKDAVLIPEKHRSDLPTSFDVVGDLVLIKIPDQMRPFGPAIGEAILKVHKNVKGVFHDDGVHGPFRVRTLSSLAGEARTRTAHTEFGAKFEVDVAKAYFSPRLANEHERVAALVRPGEIVADLTAGVGPFAVLTARKRQAAKIYAVDLNPDAVALLKENVRMHRVESLVEVVEGDGAAIAATLPSFSRAIVNLPHGGEEILVAAARKIQAGGTLHSYRVWPEPEKAARIQELVERVSRETGRTFEVVTSHAVHAYSPQDRLFAVDLRVAS